MKKAGELGEKRVGRLAVSWRPQSGLRLTIDGVPVVRQSSLYLVKRGWKGVLFGQPTAAWATDGWTEAGEAMLTARNGHAEALYRLTLTESALTVMLTLRQLSREPADWEHAAAYLSGNLLETPPPAPGRTQEQNRLIARRIETPLGALSLSASGERDTLFDARSDAQGWAQAFPTLWWGIGSPAPEFPPGGERTVTFTIEIGPRPVRRPASAPTLAWPVAQREAFAPTPPKSPTVIPTPKEASYGGPPLRLSPRMLILHDELHAGAARLLAEGVAARTGWKIALKNEGSGLRLGRGTAPTPPENPEGYAIVVDGSGARAAGRDEAGRLWAAQTLLQLIAVDRRGPLIYGTRIRDWPTLKLRGVHLFHGQSAPAFHKKLIERVFAPFKLNTLVLQVEQVRWRHDPAVAPPWAGTPEGLKSEIAFARERGISCVPLVQGYGHMEWLFSKTTNRDLAEDPQTPYAVNFSNPAAVRYLEGFLDEADTLFGASAFHAGLDEVTMRGRFPHRSAGKGFVELFTGAVAHWRDFFHKRGKPLWMWADMALHPSEVAPCFGTAPSAEAARAVRERLPRDVVLFDWQYGPHESFPSLRRLKEAGFTNVVAATWYNPKNVVGFARAAVEAGALGALQTTWCGYESKESVLETIERRQFTAMVLAAEAFWNGGRRSDWDPEAVFTAAWMGHDPARARPRAGFTLGGRVMRSGDGTLYDSSRPLPLCGALERTAQPSSVAIPLGGARASELSLLLSTTHPTDPGTLVGRLTLVLASGEVREAPLLYGKNIAVGAARPLTIPLGPSPVALRELRIESLGTEAAPVLQALTGLV